MSIFEWFIEKDNPNPTGDFKDREPPHQDDPVNWVALIIGQAMFWYGLYCIVFKNWSGIIDVQNVSVIIAFFLTYIALGYKIDVEPNYDNMGWFGVFDNPFRYTDDVNRWLFFFKIILYPGYLMGESFIQVWKLLFKNG
jgi:hypothetical protein